MLKSRRFVVWQGLAFFLGFQLACSQANPSSSSLDFDSARLIPVDMSLESALVQMPISEDPLRIDQAIRRQLRYSIGQLNGIGGAPSLESMQIEVLGSSTDPLAADKQIVEYSARFTASWPRTVKVPETLTLYLPGSNEDTFIRTFLNDPDGGKRCLDPQVHDLGTGNSWYYYRPAKLNCEVRQRSFPDISVIEAKVSLSALQSEGHYPEYRKVWEDGRLVATLVFGKNDDNATSENDAGIKAFRNTFKLLKKAYGAPLSSTLSPLPEELPPTLDFVQMIFQTPSGPLDVQLELLSRLGTTEAVEKRFIERYNARTEISDFVLYSGHSGLGSKITYLMSLGRFVSGQYQIFRFNGCDTFAYKTDVLEDAHLAANPGSRPGQFLDIVSNSQPSKFSTGSTESLLWIDALVKKEKTYKQILALMEPAQQSAVTGEEDNEGWPTIETTN